MARELYNWNQVRAYSVIALNNIKEKNIEINFKNFIRELDTLQTSFGKDGVIGYSNRLLNRE